MAASSSRGGPRFSTGFPKMKYIKVTIYTDGILIAGKNHVSGQNYKYRKIIKFPGHLQEDVKQLLIEKQKEKPGIFDVETYDTISIELGGLQV